MRFGDLHGLAIEANFLEIHDKWIYGQLRFWIAGSPVGDFDDTSDLASSARAGRIFLAESSRRTRPDLDHVEARQVYDVLYGQFVVDASGIAKISDVELSPPVQWPLPVWDSDPYVMDDIGESALRDKFAVVALRRGDGRDRIIVKSFEESDVSETLLLSGSCDAVVEQYCLWVEQLR